MLGYTLEIHHVKKGMNELPNGDHVHVGFDGIIVRVFNRSGKMIYNKHRKSIWEKK